MERENLISYLTGISHSVGKGMAGFSHAPACCVSKHRSGLRAGKKQAKRSLDYGYSMAEVPLYPFISDPLVFLWYHFGVTEDTLYVHTGFSEM